MTVSDLQTLEYSDFRNMSDYERKQVMKDMKRNVRQRIRRLQKQGIESLASSKISEDFIKDLTSMNNKYKTNRDFLKAQKFLKAETSTVTGHKRWLKKQVEATGIEEIKDLNKKELSEMFNLVESIRNAKPDFFEKYYDSTQAVSAVEALYTQNKKAGIQMNYHDMLENAIDYISVLRQQEGFLYASY